MLERSRGLASCALALVVGASSGCEEEGERPLLAQDCNDPACLDARGDSIPLPLPMSPGDGSSAGSGGAGSTGELSGSVLEIASEDLVTTRSLQGDVAVRAPSASGGEDIVIAPSADGSYRFEGIVRSEDLWVQVGNFEDPPVETFIPTLQRVDSRRAGVTDLHVLRTDMLRGLAVSSFLNPSVELSLEQAHLILRFVDIDNEPLEGVQITSPEPENVPTAYDSGSIYSDALEATSVRGMAILLNIDAPPWPGSPLAIFAEFEGEQRIASVQLARGAVTVVTAVVTDP